MFKRNWKSAGLMWLVMVGIWIAVGIAGLIVFFLLIPAYLVLLIPAALVAVLPALIAFGITSIFASGPLTWIIALLAALPFFFVMLFAPLLLVGGWYKIYESNIWTLTYREMKALENLAAPTAPAAAAPGPENLKKFRRWLGPRWGAQPTAEIFGSLGIFVVMGYVCIFERSTCGAFKKYIPIYQTTPPRSLLSIKAFF